MFSSLSIRSLVLATAVALAPFALQAQAANAAICNDGTTSTATGRGACSGHGGVAKKTSKAKKSASKSATKAEVKADVKGETKTAKKSAKKSAAKTTKAAEKATSTAVTSDVRETGKTARPTTTAAPRTTVATRSAIPTRAATNTDPTGATAKCKDGTYSHAQNHRGACSNHGGVAEWLKS